MKELSVKHQVGKVQLESFVASPKGEGPFPGALIFHAWGGRDDFMCEKARKLADKGYIAMAVDVYGNAKLGGTNDKNLELMMPLMQNRSELLSRIQSAYQTLLKQQGVDASKIVALGYCFGGLCVLDLARSGADFCAAVSFHGNLTAPDWKLADKIGAKVLVLHGYKDPLCPPGTVMELGKELTLKGADWHAVLYGKAYHSFTDPEVNDADFGTVFDEISNARSWQAMGTFFKEMDLPW